MTTLLGGWTGDLRQAVRSIRQAPTFAVVVIGTLALAVGGVTAVFTLADPMLFRPLPYPDADRIVRASINGENTFGFGTLADYYAAKAASSFEAVGDFDGPILGRLGDDPDQDYALGYAVTEGFLDVLSIGVARGHLFTAADYRDAPDRVGNRSLQDHVRPALITSGLWRRAFGGAENILDQTLALRRDGRTESLHIVGVLRPDFVFPDLTNQSPDFLVPGRLDRAQIANPRTVATIFARLRPGVSPDRAAVELQAIVTTVERGNSKVPQHRKVALLALRDSLFRRVRPAMLMLLVVTLGVLLLAVGNLAHLCVARATERSQEIAVRRALGAGGWRIVRLLCTEAIVLSVIGGLAALLLGRVLFAVVMTVVPRMTHVYRLMPAGFNPRVAAAATLVTVGAVVVFGLLPALAAARADIRGPLQAVTAGARRGRHYSDRLLTALQTALAVGILVTATLLVGSFVKLAGSIQGIDLNGLSLVSVELPPEYSDDPHRVHDLSRDLVSRLQARTTQRLGVSRGLPGITLPSQIRRSGDPLDSEAAITAYPADRSFLDMTRLQLAHGRFYSDDEAGGNALVAVVDERAAAFLWPGEDPLGKTVMDFQSAAPVERAVVGVVREIGLDFKSSRRNGFAFVPLDPAGGGSEVFLWRGLVTGTFREAIREVGHEVEPRAVISVRILEPFERPLGEPRLLARLFGSLALLALVLTIAGVYSIVSHTVVGRTGEIGVRIALGATAGGIQWMILVQSLVPTLSGILLGAALSLWWTQGLRSLLFGFDPSSLVVLIFASSVVLLIAALASLVPARRASRVDAVLALRSQ